MPTDDGGVSDQQNKCSVHDLPNMPTPHKIYSRASANPAAPGAFDVVGRPNSVLKSAAIYLAAAMFAEVPSEADVYSLKMVLHDWNESECTRIPANDTAPCEARRPHLHRRAHCAGPFRMSFLETLRHPCDVLGQWAGAY